MKELSQRDALTGLPDRGHLWNVLENVLIQIRRSNTYCGVLLININDLDKVKDLMNDNGVSEYIKVMASRIQKSLWEMDTAVKFSDNQFVVIANSIQKTEDIHVVMQKVCNYLAIECEIGDFSITPSISIGITLLPYDGNEIDEIMENTVSALQMALSKGANEYWYYNQDLGQKIEDQDAIKKSIMRTLTDESFVLKLQPKIDAKTREVCGVEALVRMRDSDGNIVPPDEFIPVAENSNLILEIGDWVLKKSHDLSLEWKKKGISLPISVNISDVQFKNGAALLSTLHNLLSNTDGELSNLILEVSENVITKDVDLAAALLFEIQTYGYRLSIDGFGSGFSCLSVLKDLKVDEIKVDRNFLNNVPDDGKNSAILKSIIMLGKSMGFRVVAMGVESKEQSEFLKEFDCDEFQGYLISEPMDFDEFPEWLENYNKVL